MAKTESVTIQMERILDQYDEKVHRETNKAMDTASKGTASKLKNESPRRPGGGQYAKGWAVHKERDRNGLDARIVYNKTAPYLTHLLENGHVIKNGKGEFGRVGPVKHIAPAEEWGASEYQDEIERGLEQ